MLALRRLCGLPSRYTTIHSIHHSHWSVLFSTDTTQSIDHNDNMQAAQHKQVRSQRTSPSLTQRIRALLSDANHQFMSKSQLYDALVSASDTTDNDNNTIAKPKSVTHLGRVLQHLVRQRQLTVLAPTNKLLSTPDSPYIDITKLTKQDALKHLAHQNTIQSTQSFVYSLIDRDALKQRNIQRNELQHQRAVLRKQQRYQTHLAKYPNAAIGDQRVVQYVEKKPSKYKTYAERHGTSS